MRSAEHLTEQGARFSDERERALGDICRIWCALRGFDFRVIPTVIDEVESTVGAVEALVNNARYGLEDLTMEQFRQQFEVNDFSAVAVMKAVLPPDSATSPQVGGDLPTTGGRNGRYC